jgi:cation diffusion facilitator CzcD-associated flavoprotein CzcO
MSTRRSSSDLDVEILIVGSGFSGLGAAIELKRLGIHDFVILERAHDLGGTWRDNTYPGLTVDVASTTYSYAFEPNPDWSRLYAPGSEVKRYADHCADKYGLREHLRCGKTVVSASYDRGANTWTTTLADGETWVSRYLVSATGLFGPPKLPEIPGIESFAGKLVHTAQWDHGYDLTGKRVAVIGTGATAIQLIPEIVERVAHLDVYQRTPIWLMPKPDFAMSERVRAVFRAAPITQKLARWTTNVLNELLFGIGFSHYRQFPYLYRWLEKLGIDHIRKQVADPAIQEKLIPRYTFFCKRPSFSNVYFPVFNRANVSLVTEPIARVTPNAIVTADGVEREIDVLVCATGYSTFEKGIVPAFPVYGKDGREIGEYWSQNRFRSFQGITVPGFPNYFMIFGPYSAASASWFGMIDTQTRHLGRCLKTARRRGANYVEVKQRSFDEDFASVMERRQSQVVFHGNCASSRTYYYDRNGDVPLVRPSTQLGAWAQSHLVRMSHYTFASAGKP